MAQLEQVTMMTFELIQEAQKRLNRKDISPEAQIMNQLRGFSDQRMQCPFCLYESKSAIIRNGCFKCFACGKWGVVPR